MTGYGRGVSPLGRGQLVVEVRAVNHRFLDLRVRVDPEVASEAGLIEDHARKHVARGRVDLSVRLEGKLGGELVLDRSRARTAFAELRALRDELAPTEPVPLSLLSGVPALFSESGLPAAEERSAAAQKAVRAACEDLLRMRRQEGSALQRDLASRVRTLIASLDRIEPLAANQTALQRDKLQQRVAKLLEGSQASLDRDRLELEVALLADRADVSEELTRLRSHLAQLGTILAEDSDEPIGRKLEFLMQELGREANTAGAKISDVSAAHHILDMKAELERMREQVQNVV